MAPRCKLVAARTLFYVVLLSLAHTAKSQTGSCPAGYQDTDSGVGTVCAQCASGFYKSTTGTGSCSPCPLHTYNNAQGAINCTDCPPNTGTKFTGKQYVVNCVCNVGYTGPHGGPCDECEAGKYKYSIGNQECYECLEGTYSDSAATECIACPEGTFSATMVASSCTECAAGKFTTSTGEQSCTSCPEGKTSPVGSSNAAQCVSPPPTTSTTVVVQAASANITFEPLNYTQLNCVACAAGFYLSPASLNCTACPEGSSTFAYRNASSALHCVCRPGFENASTACEPCEAGFYKEELANASCVRCPANSWTLDDGSANVSACVCDPGFAKPSFTAPPPVCVDDPSFSMEVLALNIQNWWELEDQYVFLGCKAIFDPDTDVILESCTQVLERCYRCCASCRADCLQHFEANPETLGVYHAAYLAYLHPAQGPAVFLWESLDEEGRKECEETMRTRKDTPLA